MIFAVSLHIRRRPTVKLIQSCKNYVKAIEHYKEIPIIMATDLKAVTFQAGESRRHLIINNALPFCGR